MPRHADGQTAAVHVNWPLHAHPLAPASQPPGLPHLRQRGGQVLQQAARLLPRLPPQLVVLKGGSQLGGAAGALQAHTVAPAVCGQEGGRDV